MIFEGIKKLANFKYAPGTQAYRDQRVLIKFKHGGSPWRLRLKRLSSAQMEQALPYFPGENCYTNIASAMAMMS